MCSRVNLSPWQSSQREVPQHRQPATATGAVQELEGDGDLRQPLVRVLDGEVPLEGFAVEVDVEADPTG